MSQENLDLVRAGWEAFNRTGHSPLSDVIALLRESVRSRGQSALRAADGQRVARSAISGNRCPNADRTRGEGTWRRSGFGLLEPKIGARPA